MKAGVNFSAFGGATSGSSNSTITAGYDGEFELNQKIPIDYFISAKSGRTQFTTNFVEDMPETETKTTNFGINMGLTLLDSVSVSYDYTTESVNSGAVTAKEYRITPGFHFAGISISYAYGQKKVSQIKTFIMFPNLPLLTHDYTDELAYTQGIGTAKIRYRFTDNFEMSISQTKFNYDKNMESAYTFLSTPATYNSNGFDMLSQIYSILDSSTEIFAVYTIGDMADIEVSVGKTVDFYHPKSESSDVRLGTMVYQTSNFMWGVGITSTRSSSENTPARSYDGTLAYSF